MISKSLWLLSPVTRVDLSEEMILHLIRPVGVLAMTGTARGPLTGMSGTAVVVLMKGWSVSTDRCMILSVALCKHL